MKKSLILLAIISVVCIALVACTSGNSTNTTTTTTEETPVERSPYECFFELNYDGQSYSLIRIEGINYDYDSYDIVIPDTYEGLPVTDIEYNAFEWLAMWSNNLNIFIPHTVERIETDWLYSTGCLGNIDIDENNKYYKSIDGNVYSKDGKTLIRYAPNKTNSSFSIPNGVTKIGGGAFSDCFNLSNIYIPYSVTEIGNSAFYDCDSLYEIIIPHSVTTIGDYTFYDCDSLCEIIIPHSVTTIGDGAFEYCSALGKIELEDNPESQLESKLESIGYDAFDGTNINHIEIPKSVKNIAPTAFDGRSFKNIYVDAENKYYSSSQGVLYNKDLTSLVKYPSGKIDYTFTVPSTVKSIGDSAFFGATDLAEVIISDNVESIGECAFDYLVRAYIGKSVKNIADSAFKGVMEICNASSLHIYCRDHDYTKHTCKSLEESYIKIVEDCIFYDDGTEVYLVRYFGDSPIAKLPKYDLGKEYSIYKYTFYYSDIQDVIIPDFVKNIDYGAFYSCNSIKNIYCEAESQPDGWHELWNWNYPSDNNINVIWGYK